MYQPKECPFFSVVLFQWYFWESDKGKAGHGWDREPKYNLTEYGELQHKVGELLSRFRYLPDDPDDPYGFPAGGPWTHPYRLSMLKELRMCLLRALPELLQ